MCVAGFVANTSKYEDQMKPPGFYWTWSMVGLVAIGFFAGMPWWVRVVGFAVLVSTIVFWQADKRKAGTR